MRYEEWAAQHLNIRSLSFNEANVVCPFHDDHSPSLRFNMDTGLFYCHGCHEAGTIHSLAEKLGVGAPEGGRTLSEVENMLLDVSQEKDQLRERMQTYPEAWLDQFDYELYIEKFWIEERGLSWKTVNEFHLGWDYPARAGTIPIRDHRGKLQGVVRRFVEDDAPWKYLNPKGFSKAQSLLFLDHIEGTTVVLCEGPIDALKVWDAEVPAVATYGAGLSTEQARLLREHGVSTVVTFYDNDPAGKLGTMRVDQKLKGVVHFVAPWPPFFGEHSTRGMDPGQLSRDHIRAMTLSDAIPFHRWQFFR